MDTSIVYLDAELSAEPHRPQFERKVSYENDTGLQLSIHLPCGAYMNLPPRASSQPRMVLYVYVTYAVPSTVQLNGIIGRETSLVDNVSSKLDNDGSVTFKYELRDMSALSDGKIVLIDKLNVAVIGGFAEKNLFPDTTYRYLNNPAVVMLPPSKDKLVTDGDDTFVIRKDCNNYFDGQLSVSVFGNMCKIINDEVWSEPNLPFRSAENAEEIKATVEKINNGLIEHKEKETRRMEKSLFDYVKEKETSLLSLSGNYDSVGVAVKRDLLDNNKFVREETSNIRKDTTDLLKWGPGTIIGLAGVVSKVL